MAQPLVFLLHLQVWPLAILTGVWSFCLISWQEAGVWRKPKTQRFRPAIFWAPRSTTLLLAFLCRSLFDCRCCCKKTLHREGLDFHRGLPGHQCAPPDRSMVHFDPSTCWAKNTGDDGSQGKATDTLSFSNHSGKRNALPR